METFVRAKQDADRLRDEGLTDPVTGFYNTRGILRRTREIGADAVRFERPLTCVAFGPHSIGQTGASDTLAEELSERVAAALRSVTRLSDTIGRLGPGEFVVVAPGTDKDGAVRLADRVLEALDASGSPVDRHRETERILAGFCTIAGAQGTTPEDLLHRATLALRKAQADDGSFRVRAYDA
jgi:diguanylate cyclase (GGDEF)-like protein